jgi:hypothetical protein
LSQLEGKKEKKNMREERGSSQRATKENENVIMKLIN